MGFCIKQPFLDTPHGTPSNKHRPFGGNCRDHTIMNYPLVKEQVAIEHGPFTVDSPIRDDNVHDVGIALINPHAIKYAIFLNAIIDPLVIKYAKIFGVTKFSMFSKKYS